jgi:hypothetical protein
MQDLDQLVGITSLDKAINKKQMKKLGGKKNRGPTSVQKGRSKKFSTGQGSKSRLSPGEEP